MIDTGGTLFGEPIMRLDKDENPIKFAGNYFEYRSLIKMKKTVSWRWHPTSTK